MQKPIYNVFTKRGKLVAIVSEVSTAGNISYSYIGKFAGCHKTLEAVKDSFARMGQYSFVSIEG